MTFKFKNGKTLEFQEFPAKSENSRKIRIHFNGGDVEKIWAIFNDEDLKKYDDDSRTSTEYEAVVILDNGALFMYPHASWGMYIPVKFCGDHRPECNINDLEGDLMFCKERLEADAKAKAETDEKKA